MYVAKCVLIGDHGVGKSSLAHVFANGHFNPTINSTIGIAFVSKTLTLSDNPPSEIKLQIWDTAGSERYSSIVTQYLRDTNIAFIVFDMTRRESWNNITKWYDMITNQTDNNIIIVLVGTKADQREKEVSSEEIKKVAKKWNCKSYVISSVQANSYSMIYRMFTIAAHDFHEKVINDYDLFTKINNGKQEKGFRLTSDTYGYKKFCCFQ